MTASKKAVRTRRGVEPTGRPARREVERGRRARTNSSTAAVSASVSSCAGETINGRDLHGRRESDGRTRAARVLLLALVEFLLAGRAGGEGRADLGLDLRDRR